MKENVSEGLTSLNQRNRFSSVMNVHNTDQLKFLPDILETRASYFSYCFLFNITSPRSTLWKNTMQIHFTACWLKVKMSCWEMTLVEVNVIHTTPAKVLKRSTSEKCSAYWPVIRASVWKFSNHWIQCYFPKSSCPTFLSSYHCGWPSFWVIPRFKHKLRGAGASVGAVPKLHAQNLLLLGRLSLLLDVPLSMWWISQLCP